MTPHSLKRPALRARQKAAAREWCPTCRAFRRRGHEARCQRWWAGLSLAEAFLAAARRQVASMRRLFSWYDTN